MWHDAQRRPFAAILNTRDLATKYVADDFQGNSAARQSTYSKLVEKEKLVNSLPEKHLAKAREDEELTALLAQAHELNAASK